MISLFIDTAASNLVVGLYEDDKILFEKIEKSDNNLSERLLPMIDEAFFNNKINIRSVDHIFVVNGPGSFTGIRIGVTVAKTIAWSLNKKINSISELEVLATTNSKKKYRASLIDARREFVYAGLYDDLGEVVFKDKYISLNEFRNNLFKFTNVENIEFISDDTFVDLDTIKPKIDILNIIKKYSTMDSINPHQLNPNYMKLTEAEEKKILND